jgi:hypothetical protein
MIDLERQGNTIEIASYSDDATLEELRERVDTFRVQKGLKTAGCAGCGECCFYENLPVLGFDLRNIRDFLGVDDETLFSKYLELPERPTEADREQSIEQMKRDHGFDDTTARLLYEYNQSEPVRLRKSAAGSCMFLEDNLCTIYQARLYTCGLYVCNMADKLSVLQEQIVRQGIWHSYHVLGWIGAGSIAHNPFLDADGYGDVPVKAFDFDLSDALEQLFFYF